MLVFALCELDVTVEIETCVVTLLDNGTTTVVPTVACGVVDCGND